MRTRWAKRVMYGLEGAQPATIIVGAREQNHALHHFRNESQLTACYVRRYRLQAGKQFTSGILRMSPLCIYDPEL